MQLSLPVGSFYAVIFALWELDYNGSYRLRQYRTLAIRPRSIYFFLLFCLCSIREGGLFIQPSVRSASFQKKKNFPIKVYLQDKTLSLAFRDRSIEEGSLFHLFIIW